MQQQAVHCHCGTEELTKCCTRIGTPAAQLQVMQGGPLRFGAGACAVARQLQEQQLKARQLVLQQQAASATAAASKTQREVRSGSALQRFAQPVPACWVPKHLQPRPLVACLETPPCLHCRLPFHLLR